MHSLRNFCFFILLMFIVLNFLFLDRNLSRKVLKLNKKFYSMYKMFNLNKILIVTNMTGTN